MKKIYLLLLAALMICSAARAIPAQRHLFTMTQGDGTTVQLYIHGDHRSSFYTTPDGYVVVPGANRMYCYAKVADGKLVASATVCHDAAQRTAAEQTFLAAGGLRPSGIPATATMRKGGPRRILATSTSDGLGKYGESAKGSLPSVGERKIPVIMVQFADISFREEMTTAKLTRFLNEEGYHEDNEYEVGSVRDYFVQNSHGMFKPTFDVVGIVTLSQGYAYYGQHGVVDGQEQNDLHVHDAFVQEAIQLAMDQGVDFSKYVDEKTQQIPNVICLYAGYGEATGGDPYTIWPHELDLYAFDPKLAKVGDYTFTSYFVGNERHGNETGGDRIEGVGVLIHELGHALGLPDFYVTDYSYGETTNFGDWSVMDMGCYNAETYAPVGYTAYELSYLGWLDIPELKDAQKVTLKCPTDESLEGMAAIFRNPNNANEYFILENRQPRLWIPVYQNYYGTGLMLHRIAYDAKAWENDVLNNDSLHRRAYMVPADGSEYISMYNPADEEHLFGNGTDSKATYTLYDGSTLEGYGIYNITKHDDGTLTFDFREDPTAIESVTTTDDATDEPVYTLGGQRLDRITQPGIYIQGKKKVVFR